MHNCFPCTSKILKTSHELTMSQGCFRLIWNHQIKGQGNNELITENGFCCINALPLQLLSWNFKQRLPMSRGCVLLFFQSKGQGQNPLITENDWQIAFPSHLSSWNSHTDSLWDEPYWLQGHKVKSQGHIHYFPFTLIIMKLLKLTPRSRQQL